MQIPAPFDSAGIFLSYPVNSPVQEVYKRDRKSAVRTVLIANFRLFSRSFALF